MYNYVVIRHILEVTNASSSRVNRLEDYINEEAANGYKVVSSDVSNGEMVIIMERKSEPLK